METPERAHTNQKLTLLVVPVQQSSVNYNGMIRLQLVCATTTQTCSPCEPTFWGIFLAITSRNATLCLEGETGVHDPQLNPGV